jgi:hypothetical protein
LSNKGNKLILEKVVSRQLTSARKFLTNLLWTFSLKLYGTGSKIGDRIFRCIASVHKTPCRKKVAKPTKNTEGYPVSKTERTT